MLTDLEASPDLAAQLCAAAHQRLLRSVHGMNDGDMTRSSRLPDWSIAHVLTHLARNADGHARRLAGALSGKDLPKYPGGEAQRAEKIAAGAERPSAEIIADLERSQHALEGLFETCSAAGWPSPEFGPESTYGASACPAHRLREVEMHHVDLGVDYGPKDWSADYVAWDLANLLRTVPQRLHDEDDRRAFMAWLAGRADLLSAPSLDPWG